MSTTPDPMRIDPEELVSELLGCRRELAQVRAEQEAWEEKFHQLRLEREQAVRQSAELAAGLAEHLRSSYWRGRGVFAPVSLQVFIASRWPWLRRVVGGKPPADVVAEMEQVRLIEQSPDFDARWYLQQNPDVAQAGIHPALHYLRDGGREGRNPGPDFDAGAYRRQHPELAAADNPLLHCLRSRHD